MAKALEPWVTSEEICKYLRISANTLTRWIADRGMPVHRVGRSLRFKVAEIDEWIRSGHAAGDKGAENKGQA
jgi:excisionase family DNA binding protein